MALFSLLVVLTVERFRWLKRRFQFNEAFSWYLQVIGLRGSSSQGKLLLAMVLPASVVWSLEIWVAELWLGALSLLLWIFVGLLLFAHESIRLRFRQYLRAAEMKDFESCYYHADLLDETKTLRIKSQTELGYCMGQVAAWINYRLYAAVALYFVLLGPVAATLYCTVRALDDHFTINGQRQSVYRMAMLVLDWLPVRLVSFGFALSGRFDTAASLWVSLAPKLQIEPRKLLTEVALAAEDIPETQNEPVCTRSTLALLQLAKRNFVMLMVLVSLLTIFGVLS